MSQVLNEQQERLDNRFRPQEQGYDLGKVIERVSELFSLSEQDILVPSRQRKRVMGRSVLCFWAIRELGMSGVELSHVLKLGQSSVSRAVGRGELLVRDMKLSLISELCINARAFK